MKPIFRGKKPHFYQIIDHHLSLMNCTIMVFTFHSSLPGILRCVLELSCLAEPGTQYRNKKQWWMLKESMHFPSSQLLNRSTDLTILAFTEKMNMVSFSLLFWYDLSAPSFLLSSLPPFLLDHWMLMNSLFSSLKSLVVIHHRGTFPCNQTHACCYHVGK